MKKIFIYIASLLGCSTAMAQGEWVSGSIDNIPSATTTNLTGLFIRTTTAFDANKVDNIVFTIRVPKTAGNAVLLTAQNKAPEFGHLTTVSVDKYTASDATWYYYLINLTGNVQGAAGATIPVNTPFKVIEFTYGGGTSNGNVQLVNLENDLPGNVSLIAPQFYVQNSLGDITNRTAMFYGSGGAVAQNNVGPNQDDFVPTPSPVVLPLKITSFNAVRNGNNGLLNWTVENQQAINDHFEIERSFNGVNFEKVGSNVPVVVSGSTGSYNYTDLGIIATRNSGVIYYRIKQVDKDGQFVYSEVRSIRLSPRTTLGIYPNPAVSFTTLTMDLADASPVTVRVIDAHGKQLDLISIAGNKGLNTKRLDLAKYAAGTYMLSIQVGTELTETLTFVKAQ